MLSLSMIVRDEEQKLGTCLESVKGFCDELVVVDTGSSDNTIAIAKEAGARVEAIEWPGDFTPARNKALEFVSGDWVLVLDADEQLVDSVKPALQALMAIHLERLLPAVSSDLPGHDAGSHLNGAPFECPYLILLQMGFAMPVLLPGRRCALTAPFHPYHGRPRGRRWRYFFCGTFPRVTPAGCYPAS